MDALQLLTTRRSQPRLQAPAPTGDALEQIMQAALQVPDHASLKPWQFIVCTGEGLDKLGQVFDKAAKAENMSERDQQRAAQLPLRAPMVIVAICKYHQHPKVPWVEQVASASCAIQAMQMAAVAQGFQGIWRTGAYAHSQAVKKQLGLQQQDEIVGFLYMGSPQSIPAEKPNTDTSAYFSHWL